MSIRIMPVGIAALALLLCACGSSEGGATASQPVGGLPSSDAIAAVPMDHIAGVTDSTQRARSIRNPYGDSVQAIAEGKSLYIRMNCAGCHAYTGKGNMGPDLTDTYWRYGGFPVDIYKSIHDGRAQGMPAWGAALPPKEIWKLVAYIQSFGGSFAANGVPRGVQRGDVIAHEAARQPEGSLAPAPPPPPAPLTPPANSVPPPASIPPATPAMRLPTAPAPAQRAPPPPAVAPAQPAGAATP